MHKIHYKIKTLSPILLTWMTGDRNMVSTLDYIPGSAVLGIFANKYIEQNKPGYLFSWEEVPGNDSVRLIEFLMQNFNIEWIKAAKINKNDDGKTIRITNDTNFLSLTLNNEKNNVNIEIDDGRTDKFIVKTENGELNIYKLGNKAHEDHYFYQCFLNSGLCFTNAYLTRNNGKENAIYYPTPFSINTSKKKNTDIFDLIIKYKEETENIGNFCNIKDDKINFISAKKSINFHHARDDRLKGHSNEGIIFNYESLDPWQEFSGWIIGKQTDLNTILDLVDSPMKINIGKSRHIQYGEGELELIYDNPGTPVSEITAFDPKIINNPFILTFWSPAIFYNECGFPSTSLSVFKNQLSSHLEVQPESIHIINSFKKSETIENFISIWQLKKPSDVCIKAGSCFKIKIDDMDDRIKNLLSELQVAGIGERIGEGFGRFLINMQTKEEYKSQRYLFSWDKIPGNDNERLIEFLMQNYSIEWIKTANINKKDDGKTISVTNDKNSLSLTLNNEKTNVNLEIDDVRTDKFIVKTENGELNIYSQSMIDQENEMPSGYIPEITQTIIKNVITKSYLTLAEVQALEDCQGFCRLKNRIPTNSLLGKLIFMVKKSKDVDHLINKVSELPSTATDNIRKCKNNQVNLLKFIETSHDHIVDILNHDSDLKKCCNLIRFEPDADEELMNKIYSHYWLTFLAVMRKEKKKGRN